jgi:hypothetical protein
MRIIETPVYTLTELSDAAKERARSWYREGLDYEWWDTVYDDFETICRILGVDLRTQIVRLYGGGTRQKPSIWFSGFWNQGDGACFEGTYRHAKGAPAALRAHAPLDTELHAIADHLAELQRRNFYELTASIRHHGRYSHAHSMTIDVERDSPNGQPPTTGSADAITQALRDLAHWLYRQLQREYDYLTSNEAVDESIEANEYTFTAEGRRFG